MSEGRAPEILAPIIEALLLTSGQAMNAKQIASIFDESERPTAGEIGKALEHLAETCEGRAVELREVASGFRLQVRENYMAWVSRLWEERPQRYSRAMLETLALIAYRQPITRGDIEEVRGVSVSSNIIRTLQEREWIRVVGHRDVPGKPALFGTTRAFLDYFNLTSLDDLPSLAEIKDIGSLEPEFEFDGDASNDDDDGEAPESMDHAEAESESEATSEAELETEADGEAELESEDSDEIDEPAESRGA